VSDAQTPIWREEPVRGGYPEPWVLGLPGRERLERWRVDPPIRRSPTSRARCRPDSATAPPRPRMPASAWLANDTGLLGGGASRSSRTSPSGARSRRCRPPCRHDRRALAHPAAPRPTRCDPERPRPGHPRGPQRRPFRVFLLDPRGRDAHPTARRDSRSCPPSMGCRRRRRARCPGAQVRDARPVSARAAGRGPSSARRPGTSSRARRSSNATCGELRRPRSIT
jgi:hypothetical protein